MTKATGRRLEHLDKKVTSVNEAVSKLTSNDDVCLILLYDEQLDTFKVELDDIYQSVLSSDEPEDELSIRQTELAQKLFDCLLVVKRLLENNSPTPTPTSTPTSEGIKLPKIDLPSFDGNILHRQTFWDQFCISIHHCTNLSLRIHRTTTSENGKVTYQRGYTISSRYMFAIVGVDYAGPIKIKSGPKCKPIIVKAYICVFVTMSVKAVHIEVVSDLTTGAFLSCLRCFIACRGKPKTL